MNKKIQSALISVFYKEGIDILAKTLHEQGVKIYSTGGTQTYLEEKGIPCIGVESVTSYPSILGGRVKTLHPKLFGGILGRRENETDLTEMAEHDIPEIDLVIVNLYPFEETVANTDEEAKIIEKIDIGGPSMIRAAAKNHKDVVVLASPDDYDLLNQMLLDQNGETTLEQRRAFAGKTFQIVTQYNTAISNYFNGSSLRYGENPHQKAQFNGDLDKHFTQRHGKAISYNNLVDIDAAISLMQEFEKEQEAVFIVFKHTNACGAAIRPSVSEAWKAALAGDPESAFGGVLISNKTIDQATAEDMKSIFFEVLIAPGFSEEAFEILQEKKKRILLQTKDGALQNREGSIQKSILGGLLTQNIDIGSFEKWENVSRDATEEEEEDLKFANIICKHLKSNAIALAKNKQLIGKGAGQTSRIDALRHAIAKAEQFEFDLKGAVMASDAFFPFDDCVKIAHKKGISACIQPGGSIRDKDSIAFTKEQHMAMIMTGMRHFKH